jgi:hypothetical protein
MPMAFMFHPFWILLIILGFWAWWPLGLVILGVTLGSRRMACGYHSTSHWDSKVQRMQEKMDRVRTKMEGLRGGRDWWGSPPSSGNRAFDDYRTETLKRLEEEQREFRDFLDRLRFAKDKTEFDQFMAERRNRASDPGPQPQT